MFWIVVIVVVILIFVSAGHFYTRNLFRLAGQAEKSGKFEDATYFYGEALYNYYRQGECREKIRNLWAAHGPFTFARDRAAFTQRTDQDRDGDLEIFEDVVRVIEQVASGQMEKRCYEAQPK